MSVYTVHEVLTASILGWFAIPSSKIDLNELDYYDGVVSHPEPDILECEVKWALKSTAVNKASGCVGIPGELFKTLKNGVITVLHSICQQIWKTQQWVFST